MRLIFLIWILFVARPVPPLWFVLVSVGILLVDFVCEMINARR